MSKIAEKSDEDKQDIDVVVDDDKVDAKDDLDIEFSDPNEPGELDDTLDDENETVDDDTSDDVKASDDGETDGDDDDVDIVRASDDKGSQPKKAKSAPIGVIKRIGKLNAKVKVAESGKSEAEEALALEQEKNKLLNVALEQHRNKTEPLVRPKVSDFDDVDDPAYITALEAYEDAKYDQRVAERLNANNEQIEKTLTVQQQQKALEVKQTKHYERAEKLGAKNFAEVEDKAIEILGLDAVNVIIDNFDDSHILTYYLGKDANETEAKHLASLLSSNATLVQGIAEIGALRNSLKVVKGKQTAPEPDEELTGGHLPSNRKSDDGPAGATYT